MKRVYVAGWPITHSRSPMIQGYRLKRHGIEGEYMLEPADTETFFRSLAACGYIGCKVTVPGFEKWFGIRPEVTAELRALVEADIEPARSLAC